MNKIKYFTLAMAGITVLLLAAISLARAGVLTPPHVLALWPNRGSHNVPVDSSVSITYDQNMNPATVNPQSFAVHARQTGWLTETLSVVSGTISLDPVHPFHAGELVQASATTATLSLGGEAPITPTVWQFNTAPWGGNAAFHEHQTLANTNSRYVALGDLDGDSDLDALTTSCYSGYERVYHNDGSGTFTEVQTFTYPGTCILDAELGDLDGDGDLDAVLIDYWLGGDRVLWNDGDGTFTDSGQSLGNFEDTYAGLGDLDGDGDLDLFVASGGFDSGILRTWRNDGKGHFKLASSFDAAYGHMGVALGDLDGDGDLDAFTAGWNNSYNKVWLNDGAGNFSEAQAIGNANTTSVQLGDLDGDGDLDAYFSNMAVEYLPDQVWFNDGTGHFTDSGQRLETIISAFPALGDLDADGDLDVYLSGEANAAAPDEVWANDGAGTFSLFRTVDENYQGGVVTLGDLDNDGNLDAFVASPNDPGYQVYLNGDWTRAAPLLEITSFATTIRCLNDPNGFYMLNGYRGFLQPLNVLRHYDATLNEWTELATPPAFQYEQAAVCYEGKIYAVEGTHFYVYDIASNTWSAGPTPPRHIQRAGMGAWNGSLYVVGGDNGSDHPDGRISRFDIASYAWTQLPIGFMPIPAYYVSWFQTGPYLFAAGGRTGLNSYIAKTFRYDMSTNTWQQGPDLASPSWGTSLAATSSRLYALGSYDGSVFTDTVYFQDLSTWPNDEWINLGDPLPVAMVGMSTACTEAFTEGEIWSAGGSYYDADGNGIVVDTNLHYPTEPCMGSTVAFNLAPDSQARSGLPGESVTYTLRITNTGDIPDAYDVAITSSWSADVSTVEPLWPGESLDVLITVMIPADAPAGEQNVAVVTVTSQGDPTVWETAAITTTVIPLWRFSLDPASREGQGYPSDTVPYTLTLSNTGDLTDTYDLSFAGNAWEVTLPFTQTTLPPGGSLPLLVQVMVPVDAVPGATDAVTIMATSQGDPAQVATSTLTTTALPVFKPDLSTEDADLSGFPAKVVTYTLHLANTGNITDTFNVSYAGNLWGVTIPVTNVLLAAGQSVDVIVYVTVAEDALPGEADMVTITATSQGDPGKFAQVELTTTAVYVRVFLPVIRK